MRLLFISVNRYNYLPPMPLGLASIIGQLDESRHDIKALDLMFSEDPEADVKSALSDFHPHLIGVSIRIIDNQHLLNTKFFLPEAKKIIELCRFNSEALIVIGGTAFTACPIAIFDYLKPDFGIAGEGELVFCELLDRLERKDDCSDLPGLVWRADDGIRMNPHQFIDDLDSLKPPRRVLFDNQRYAEKGGEGNIVIKLGCAFHCLHCESPHIMGTHWRMKSPEKVADELESMEKDLGLKTIYFSDSLFNCPMDHAKEVCRSIIRRGLEINWSCLTSPAFADKELFELMGEAGCNMISLGCDTGAERMFKAMNKGYSKEIVIRAAQMLEELKLNYALWLLLGGPGEDKKTVQETVEFVNDRSPLIVGFAVGIRIMPNTRLVDIAVKEGVISADDPLMEPRFYISPDIKGWVADYLYEICADKPHWKADI